MTYSRVAACGLAVLVGVSATAAHASADTAPDPSQICDYVAQEVARTSGVPLSVLMAISLNETGRKREGRFRPWPWTVNMEGAGHWFDTREEALAYAQKEHDRGARSFDIGCFQINYKYHGEHFTSIENMFDPMANATYAAKFLSELYTELGSWERAAGAYHSRTPEYAERYAARFSRFRQDLIDQYGEEVPVIPDIVLASAQSADLPRVNNYPLLQAGGGAGLGSLVPIGNSAGVGLFGAPVHATAAPAEPEVEAE